MIGYFYVLGTLVCTIYGQVVLKWRIQKLRWEMPKAGLLDMTKAYLNLLLDPFVMSSFAMAFIASIFWVLAMTKLELSLAYPFMSLAPATVFLVGVYVFDEPLTSGKVIGMLFIIVGLIITVKYN